jgi:hypothetical protein
MFPSSGEGKEIQTLLIEWGLGFALCEGPNRVGASLPSPEDVKRPSFKNVMFSSYLEFRMMDRAHNLSDCEYYTPSSEYLRFCLDCSYLPGKNIRYM